MHRRIAVRLCIEGVLAEAHFVDWIVARARLLSLSGLVQRLSQTRIDVTVCGPEAMVDAMEIACSLGPGSVLVERIKREEPGEQPSETGFSIL